MSMAISKVMIEIFPPKEVYEIFALIQKILDDMRRTDKKINMMKTIVKQEKQPN